MAKNETDSFGARRLVVRPRIAREMLGGCGLERLYRLLNSGELESFRDGRARYVTVASIEGYIARRLSDAGGIPALSPAAKPPRREPRQSSVAPNHGVKSISGG